MDYGDLFQHLRLRGEVLPELQEKCPFYPLTSPGMPLPGPAFTNAAVALGDPMPVVSGTGKYKRCVSHGPILHYLYRRALYDGQFSLSVQVRGMVKEAKMVPGHMMDTTARGFSGGPRRARVMVIGKNPGREEVQRSMNFVGPPSQPLFEAFSELGVTDDDIKDWYVTNLVKWPEIDTQASQMPASHKADNAILLEQELRIVRPDYILCLGSDASKWLLSDHKRAGKDNAYGVKSLTGRNLPHVINLDYDDDQGMSHTAQVMAIVHPSFVYRDHDANYSGFRDGLRMFLRLIAGANISAMEEGLRHRNVYTESELARIIDEIRSDPDPLRRIVSADGEWEGDHPGEPGSYLRTVQFSTAPKEGICVVLRHQGGTPAFKPSIAAGIRQLKRLFEPDPSIGWVPRLGGHFFRADTPWLEHEGISVIPSYRAAATPMECRNSGGWETGLQHHSVAETSSYRLTDMTVKLCPGVPVYDHRVKDAITEYCKARDIKKDDLEGFGFLPPWILHPEPGDPEWGDNYAQYDPDTARRICIKHMEPGGLLDRDQFGNSSWEPYWRSHRASIGVLQMERTGIMLDKDRVDYLATLFCESADELLRHFQKQIGWTDVGPDGKPQKPFNPSSPDHCVSLLFGERYMCSKKNWTFRDGQCFDAQGNVRQIRPANVASFGLDPVKSTGKRPKLWEEIRKTNQEAFWTPSTDKEVLGILGSKNKLVMMLRDVRFLQHVFKSSLRLPTQTDTGEWDTDEEGNYRYEKGIPGCVSPDGRVRTHIFQDKETGRSSSARPPLQNISKRREDDYSRILGKQLAAAVGEVFQDKNEIKEKATGKVVARGAYFDVFGPPRYKHPIRSIFRSSPGHVLVEADFKGAELAIIAWLSGDPTLIEYVRRNQLDEDHPEFFDIHSNMAVEAFQLSCAPTKKGLKAAGLSSLRVAAKNCIFGIPYGRGAEAIARQCREEGTDVTEAECQKIIDRYFEQYPLVGRLLEELERRSQNERFVAGPFGRWRRVSKARDFSVAGEQKRQFRNFPIQNGVADAIWTAIGNFDEYQQIDPDLFRLLLQIHDAILFEVPAVRLSEFITDKYDPTGEVITEQSVLRRCMIGDVPIWPRYLDNTPMPVDKPYFFGTDIEVYRNWGEPLEAEEWQDLDHLLTLVN